MQNITVNRNTCRYKTVCNCLRRNNNLLCIHYAAPPNIPLILNQGISMWFGMCRASILSSAICSNPEVHTSYESCQPKKLLPGATYSICICNNSVHVSECGSCTNPLTFAALSENNTSLSILGSPLESLPRQNYHSIQRGLCPGKP